MASLSDLLNPAPAAESPSDPSQLPPNPYAPVDAREQLQDASEHNAGNPPVAHADPLARRTSAFGEGPFSTLPPAGDMIRRLSTNSHDTHSEAQAQRKMSSPSLEQYHMSSRSPEQACRRASILEGVAHPSFTLPPLKYTEPQTAPQQQQSSLPPKQILQGQSETSEETKGADHSFSHVAPPPLSVNAQSDGDSKTTLPGTGSPSAASHRVPNDETSASIQQDMIPPLIKSETTLSAQEIPAFIPVAPIVKREQSAIPTTEDMHTTATESRGTKRPAPKSAKKGIAKKGPPTKKQKMDSTPKSKTKSKVKLEKSATATPLDASSAPRSRTSGSPAAAGLSDEEEEDEDVDIGSPDPDAEVYCICRRPDTGTFMIGCDGKCDDWYHGKCVDILEKDKNLIDRYICPICTKNGVGVTTWKRMCRREGCRMPARLAKKDEEPSKYCSDECGVIFFRGQMDKTRGGGEGKRSSRKQESFQNDDLGPRGGVIHASELKSLVTSASTFEDFKKLGDGVLSPPATPSPTQSKRNATTIKPEEYLDEIQAQRLKDIQSKKDELRARHTLLKDQTKMINLARQAGVRTAESKGMKPKDVCGYDDLVHLTESDFSTWRESPQGQTALKTGVLDAGEDAEGSNIRASGPCLKKKCLKHYEWSKLALETNRSETMENSETMRALEREERDIKERAGLKARQVMSGDLGGHVEIHAGQGAANDEHDKAENGVEGPA